MVTAWPRLSPERLSDLPRSICATVIHNDHFKEKPHFTRLFQNFPQQAGQVLFFVEGSQDYNDPGLSTRLWWEAGRENLCRVSRQSGGQGRQLGVRNFKVAVVYGIGLRYFLLILRIYKSLAKNSTHFRFKCCSCVSTSEFTRIMPSLRPLRSSIYLTQCKKPHSSGEAVEVCPDRTQVINCSGWLYTLEGEAAPRTDVLQRRLTVPELDIPNLLAGGAPRAPQNSWPRPE
jgi:hypothetical protein